MDRKLNSRYKMAVVHFPNESAVMMKTQAYFRKVTPLMLILFIYSFERQGYRSGNFRTRNSYSKYNDFIERFRVTLKAKGKREFVPRDQVFSLHVFYCSFLLQKKRSFTLSSSIRVVSHYFYPLIFYFETFPTWVCSLPFAVCRLVKYGYGWTHVLC